MAKVKDFIPLASYTAEKLVDMLGPEDSFETKAYWEEVLNGEIIPGAKPWFKDAVGDEFYHISSVRWEGGLSPEKLETIGDSAVLKQHLVGWAKRGWVTTLAGWGEKAAKIIGCDGTVFRQVVPAPTTIDGTFEFHDDPSAERDREHKSVGLPKRTPFNHFPDLKGWIVETCAEGEEVCSAKVLP